MVQIGRTRRLKRVSWAPGVSLCQVRLFLPEDAPCQSGLSTQDHLQAKDSWSSAGATSDEPPVPPRFESVHNQNFPKTDVSKISGVLWKCPPKIVLNPEWYVVSGEESQEIANQNQRNFAVLEAVYPRQSTIPPNPSISAEAQESCHDNSSVCLVPLTAIEDDDPSDLFDSQQVLSEPSLIVTQQSNSVVHPTIAPPAQVPPSNDSMSPTLSDMSVMLSRLGAHADVAAATAVAITALTSKEKGNMIDQNLVIKILSDPSLIEKLLPDNCKPNPKPPQPTTSSIPISAPLPIPPLLPQHSAHLFNSSTNDPNPRPTRLVLPTTASGPLPPLSLSSLHNNVTLYNTTKNTNANPRSSQSMVTSTVSVPLPPPPPPPPRPHMIPSFSSARPSMASSVPTPAPTHPPQTIPITIRPSTSVTPAKDANYYKSLIKQHGGENLASTNPDVTGTSAGAMQFKSQQHGVSGACDATKSKFQKPCAFFNTATGCRRGDSCMFLHESSINLRDERVQKRVKLDNNGRVASEGHVGTHERERVKRKRKRTRKKKKTRQTLGRGGGAVSLPTSP
jgi:hypothetical protein